MNPVLLLLIGIALVVVWFMCSFLYKPIGRLFYRLFKDAYGAMTEKDENKKGED